MTRYTALLLLASGAIAQTDWPGFGNDPGAMRYSSLRQIDTGNTSLFTHGQRQGLRSLLAEPDELITLLARSDPAATDRLFTLYSTYNKVANNGG